MRHVVESAVTVSYRRISTVLLSLGHVNEYLLALKAMRAEGLIPALSGVCWFLLPVGWCSVVSAACEQQFKQQTDHKTF